MPKLVAPDGVIYVINDTGPGQPDLTALAERRRDLPPKKNLHQLFRWTPGPHNGRGLADDWQLLDQVRWAEKNGEYIPLVGSATNALKIFNRHCGTSHSLNASFYKLLSGSRGFQGWKTMPDGQMPAPAMSLADGSSLVGLRRARTLAQARAANAALNPTPMLAEGAHGQPAAEGLAAEQVRVRAFEQSPVHLHALETRAEIARERAPPRTLTPAPPSVQISAPAAPSLAVAGAGRQAAQQVRVRAFEHYPVHFHALETRARIARERAPPPTLTPAPPPRG